jgi:hypothetical protein
MEMLSTTEISRQLLIHFFLGINSIFPNLLVLSGINDAEFEKIWLEEKQTFSTSLKDYFENHEEVVYNAKTSPKSLFDFFNKNKSAIVIFNSDTAVKILKSTGCIGIIKGAVCSSPDSGNKWLVGYEGQKEFTFKGKVIMNLSDHAINWKLSKYEYLKRDGLIVYDLKKFSDILMAEDL